MTDRFEKNGLAGGGGGGKHSQSRRTGADESIAIFFSHTVFQALGEDFQCLKYSNGFSLPDKNMDKYFLTWSYSDRHLNKQKLYPISRYLAYFA